MASITLSKLIESTNIPAPLVRAVVKQLGGWQDFKRYAPDIASHGIDGGSHGFIYTRDTVAFAKRNRKAIQQLAQDQANDLGTSAIELVRGFYCFRNDKPSEADVATAIYGGTPTENTDTVLNALAWYAGEEVARAYADRANPLSPAFRRQL